MRDFLLAPIFSLFSLGFYRRLAKKAPSFGFLYLGYLSCLVSLWALFMFRSISLPFADDLVGWFAKNLPQVTFTREGLQMSTTEPILLSHPALGPLFYFDPTSDAPRPEDLEKAFVVISRKKIAYRGVGGSDYRIQNLVAPPTQREWRNFALTGETVAQFWLKLRPFLSVSFFVIASVSIFLWKLLAGLLYSLVALLLNSIRKERLPYPALFTISLFALTPATLLQAVSVQFQKFGIPINLLTGFLVTTAYLALGILVRKKAE